AANPTDTTLKTALEQAKADEAKAQAEEAKAQADNTAAAPTLPAIDIVTLNFQPLIDAKNATMNKAPFSFLYAIPGVLAPLYRTPVAPAFDIELGFGSPIHVDFSSLNWFAATVRTIFGFFLYLGLIWKGITQFSRM
ncbi:hypothetical protein JZU71_04945, partial [bacterium]|nr:hypothetical protein [bacterium]